MAFLRNLIFGEVFDIPEEELEEYRMMSGMEPSDICALRRWFLDYIIQAKEAELVGNYEEDEGEKDNEAEHVPTKNAVTQQIDSPDIADAVMTKDMFLYIPFIAVNPLKDRVVECFGFEDGVDAMKYPEFLMGVSLFNSHGKKEEKLKLAFKIQDFDGDNFISKPDLTEYVSRITKQGNNASMSEVEIQEMVEITFMETSSDAKGEMISLQDFSRAMAPTDFFTKLRLPFI
jgi:Ca2+-binding EF-hand superfamily protein